MTFHGYSDSKIFSRSSIWWPGPRKSKDTKYVNFSVISYLKAGLEFETENTRKFSNFIMGDRTLKKKTPNQQ